LLHSDVLFIQDFTGSQSPYIDSARRGIRQICADLISGTQFVPGNVRFGVIAFRDHPPQDASFVTKAFPFTSDPARIAADLASLTATGGGDGPEAQTDALHDALNARWNVDAVKVAILVTDAPPHGIGESHDGFPGGCPLRE
jgi:hypothetical protein